MRLKGFRALYPRPDLAARVASVPYDTVNTDEARALARGNPVSFLHVSRAEIDLPPDTSAYDESVYRRAAANLGRLRADGVFQQEPESRLYVYRQRMGDHVQRGVVGCCHVDDYLSGVIRRHEKTRADKEDDRTRLAKALGAQSGPVFLTYRDDAAVDAIVGRTESTAPMFDFVAPDGIAHTVWRVAPADAETLVARFRAFSRGYVADGHHRAAAAVRVAQEARQAGGGGGDEEYNWFLAVLFPAGQLNVLPYNRCVSDFNGMSAERFLERLGTVGRVTPGAAPTPPHARAAALYLAGQWWSFQWDEPAASDPVARLDVQFLQDHVLAPLLGIADPRTDRRIDFVGGIRGTAELEARVNEGRAAVAFSMWPVTVEQVMAVADADRIMPPKSTWFEPKLRSGLLVHLC